MEQRQISLKQLMVLVFCGLLSPMIRIIPRETAALAGAGGWLAPILALPVFLLALWLMVSTFRRLPALPVNACRIIETRTSSLRAPLTYLNSPPA